MAQIGTKQVLFLRKLLAIRQNTFDVQFYMAFLDFLTKLLNMAENESFNTTELHGEWNMIWRQFMPFRLKRLKSNFHVSIRIINQKTISYDCYHGEKKITKGKLKFEDSFPFFLRTFNSDERKGLLRIHSCCWYHFYI